MQKLKMHTPNITDRNIEKIAALFPNCVTETFQKNELVLAVDFDQLKQELSQSPIVEGFQERYQLNWPGKHEALVLANTPTSKTLRPCHEESVNFENTKNLFIEGDNLDALKLLQETYLNKIKMIYVDPSYNTGNDFIYSDNFHEEKNSYEIKSQQIDSTNGFRMVLNTESNGRFHSDWLSMMYSRLKLARNLLRDDGVIFISIDDHEVHNLRKICDEIYGAENFISQLVVQLNPRGRHLDRFIAKTHEYILIYGKNYKNLSTISGITKDEKMLSEYDSIDEQGQYRLLGLRNRNQAFNPTTRKNLYYPLYVNPSDETISIEKNKMFTDEVWPNAPDGIKTCWTWGKDKVVSDNHLLVAKKQKNGEWRVYRKDYVVGKDGEHAKTLLKSLLINIENQIPLPLATMLIEYGLSLVFQTKLTKPHVNTFFYS